MPAAGGAWRAAGALVALAAASGCGGARPFPPAPPCVERSGPGVLPVDVRESSGVVPASGAAGEVASYWTHNDSGWPAEIFRVSEDGRLLDRVRVTGATNEDWEDMAAGPCPHGGRCLYLADTGDNAERRARVSLFRVREPGPGATSSAPADRLNVRIPHGPRDIESLALLDDERFLMITKGRNHPVEVYRVDARGHWNGDEVVAVRVQQLGRGPARFGELAVGGATGASAAPLEGGGWVVVIRDYERLRFYRAGAAEHEGAVLREVPGARVNLRPLREAQGEGVAFAGGGTLVLTSEGGLHGGPASIRTIDCSVGFARWGISPVRSAARQGASIGGRIGTGLERWGSRVESAERDLQHGRKGTRRIGSF